MSNKDEIALNPLQLITALTASQTDREWMFGEATAKRIPRNATYP